MKKIDSKSLLIGAVLAALAAIGVSVDANSPVLSLLNSCGEEAPKQPVAGEQSGNFAGHLADDQDAGVSK